LWHEVYICFVSGSAIVKYIIATAVVLFVFYSVECNFFLDDHSRVVLDKIEEDENSDYVNASYIDVSFLILCIITQI